MWQDLIKQKAELIGIQTIWNSVDYVSEQAVFCEFCKTFQNKFFCKTFLTASAKYRLLFVPSTSATKSVFGANIDVSEMLLEISSRPAVFCKNEIL